jgi:hypothetical protein
MSSGSSDGNESRNGALRLPVYAFVGHGASGGAIAHACALPGQLNRAARTESRPT